MFLYRRLSLVFALLFLSIGVAIAQTTVSGTVFSADDNEPLMPVHCLIIPKEHYSDVADDVPEELLGHLFKVVQKVSDITGIHEGGFRLLLNTGDDASQSVRHLHIHMLGGHKMPRPNDQDWSYEANKDN